MVESRMLSINRSSRHSNDSFQVGPVAPLADACAPPGMAHGSATTAVASWVAAGMPKDKIILGVASYGRAWSVKKSDAYSSGITIASNPPFDSAHTPYVLFINVFLPILIKDPSELETVGMALHPRAFGSTKVNLIVTLRL